MRLVAGLLSVLVASSTPPSDDQPEIPVPRHREGDWVRLGQPTPTRLGREVFAVGKDVGWFSVVRIDRLWGTVKLQRVTLVRGHSAQTLNVDVRLDAHRTSTYLDLGRPRTLDAIVVDADPSAHGSYAIYGAATAPRPEVAH